MKLPLGTISGTTLFKEILAKPLPAQVHFVKRKRAKGEKKKEEASIVLRKRKHEAPARYDFGYNPF